MSQLSNQGCTRTIHCLLQFCKLFTVLNVGSAINGAALQIQYIETVFIKNAFFRHIKRLENCIYAAIKNMQLYKKLQKFNQLNFKN